jgi:hypothetical protein
MGESAMPQTQRRACSSRKPACPTAPGRHPLAHRLGRTERRAMAKVIADAIVVRQAPGRQSGHHFLVQLNGQYEGQATGETFNFEGKTDMIQPQSSPETSSKESRLASNRGFPFPRPALVGCYLGTHRVGDALELAGKPAGLSDGRR